MRFAFGMPYIYIKHITVKKNREHLVTKLRHVEDDNLGSGTTMFKTAKEI